MKVQFASCSAHRTRDSRIKLALTQILESYVKLKITVSSLFQLNNLIKLLHVLPFQFSNWIKATINSSTFFTLVRLKLVWSQAHPVWTDWHNFNFLFKLFRWLSWPGRWYNRRPVRFLLWTITSALSIGLPAEWRMCRYGIFKCNSEMPSLEFRYLQICRNRSSFCSKVLPCNQWWVHQPI